MVLGSVAMFAGGSPAPHPADAQVRWTSRALPALTRLVGDLTALGIDTDPGAGPATRMAHDASALQADLASATSIGPPPAPALRPGWTTALERVGAVVASSRATLEASGNQQYGEELGTLRLALAGAADALLHLTSDMRAES